MTLNRQLKNLSKERRIIEAERDAVIREVSKPFDEKLAQLYKEKLMLIDKKREFKKQPI